MQYRTDRSMNLRYVGVNIRGRSSVGLGEPLQIHLCLCREQAFGMELEWEGRWCSTIEIVMGIPRQD